MGDNVLVCFEPTSCQFFRASTNELDNRVDIFNTCLRKTGSVSFNEFLMMLSLKPMDSGDLIGWSSVTAPKTVGYTIKPLVNTPYVFGVELNCEPSIDYANY